MENKRLFLSALKVLLKDTEEVNNLYAAAMLVKWYRLTYAIKPQIAKELEELEQEIYSGKESNTYIWGNWSEIVEKLDDLMDKKHSLTLLNN